MDRRKESNNYVTISKPSDSYQYYAYIDAEDNTAEDIFIQHDIPVEIIKVFLNMCVKYRIVLCRIQKKNKKGFIEAVKEMRDTLPPDELSFYDKYCRGMIGVGRELLTLVTTKQ